MNQTTSGCGNCYYCFNGQCIRADRCQGIVDKNSAINEAYNPNMGVNEVVSVPYDVYTLYTKCLVCGKEVAMSMWESGSKICDECKQAIVWAKEKMKEKE